MPKPPTDAVSLAYPDVYYAAPLVEHLRERRDINIQALAPSRLLDESSRQTYSCRLLPPAALLEQGDLRILPGIGVAAEEGTGTERLVTDRPLEGVDRVAVHSDGAHLIPVLKILFREKGLPLPEFVGEGDEHVDGMLCSGNEGRGRADMPGHDLGALWRAHTDLPLVLGMWACSPGAPYRELRALLGKAAHGTHFPQSGGDATKGLLHLTLLSREADSLRAFYALAVTHGLAEANGAAIVFC